MEEAHLTQRGIHTHEKTLKHGDILYFVSTHEQKR